MKIESIIRRENGTDVVLGKTEYKFQAQDDGRHVCEVEDEAHIDRLLSIKEGFRAVEDERETTPPVAKTDGEAKQKGGRKAKDPEAKLPDPTTPPVAKTDGEA